MLLFFSADIEQIRARIGRVKSLFSKRDMKSDIEEKLKDGEYGAYKIHETGFIGKK